MQGERIVRAGKALSHMGPFEPAMLPLALARINSRLIQQRMKQAEKGGVGQSFQNAASFPQSPVRISCAAARGL